jgi:membrane fusion protein, multidrug efflux system
VTAARVGRIHQARLVAALVLCIGSVQLVTGCAPDRAHARQGPSQLPTPVRLAPVMRGPVALPIRGAGTLGAVRELSLSFRTGGTLQRVVVTEGSRVYKGQLLAVIDPTEIQQQLAQSREARQKTERDLARVRQLQEQGTLPKVEAQDVQTGAALARADVAIAEYQLQQTRLMAPEAGVVSELLVHAGEVVAPGQAAVRMQAAGNGPIARVALIDRDALAVQLGDRARVWIDARPDEALDARVSQLATAATKDTGTFAVELAIVEETTRTLPSGLTLKAEIARVEPNATQVPVASLVDGQDRRAAVFAVESGRARRIPVTIRRLTAEAALLGEPLDNVTEVVVAGAPSLRDGASVRVFR